MSTLKTTNIAHPSSASNNIVLDSSARVGIDTPSPAEKLHISGGEIRITSSNAGITNATTRIHCYESGGSTAGYFGFSSGGGIIYHETGNTQPIRFFQGGSEAARIDSSRRLLVGTSSDLDSNALIQCHKSSGTNWIRVSSTSLANDDQPGFAVVGGSRELRLAVYKHSGITNPCAYINLNAEDAAANFYWADNSDQLRTSTSASNVGTTGGTVVGTQTSDERIKNILGPVEYGLETVKQIEPVRYALKSEPDTEKLGFIAQQVQPLVPQSVFDTKEHIEGEPEDAPTKLGMEYVSLIPVLVNAIKELSAKNDALEARLAALEAA